MRRRRSKVTWLPTIGTVVGEGLATASGRLIQGFATPVNGAINTELTILTFDTPVDIDTADIPTTTMADVVGSEYMLRRIVGKVFATRVSLDQSAVDTQPPILLGCGFFVARCNDSGSGGGPDTPIGSATPAERNDNYSPLEADTIREPWIWRRTWVLGKAGQSPLDEEQQVSSDQHAANFPASTALYGSVLDGPHLDAKTMRRVTSDERLFFAASVMNFPMGAESPLGANTITLYLDYRLVGTLRRAHNRRVF